MSKIFFEQSRPTFSEIIGNGKTFEVPNYQRNYSWHYDEWEDLWLDIEELNSDDNHYMGYVVLKRTPNPKHYEIIDGQQRITTLSIICLACISLLQDWINDDIEAEDNRKRLELIRTGYIGFLEGRTLVTKAKLRLNRINEYFFRSYLVQLRKPSNISSEKPSVQKLYKAFTYFKKKVEEKFESNKSGAALFDFVDGNLGSNLFFTLIEVGDDTNAYKIFETLNARGVKLSASDLLKNYLFSLILSDSPALVEDLDMKWDAINDILGNTEVTTYLRHYWNARQNKIERKSTLFKALKRKVAKQQEALDLLNSLEENVSVYAALSDENNALWSDDERKSIKELNLFDVTQCYSLLLVAKEKLAPSEFVKLLKDIVVISFRYNIIGGQNPNELERVYNDTANKVFRGELTTAKAIFKSLESVYIADTNFKNDFATKSINTNKANQLVKYILSKLERQYGGNEIDLNDKSVTIEHILPEKPTDEWIEAFHNTDTSQYIYRIGNLTLLKTNTNNTVGRKLFGDKYSEYKKSDFKLTNSHLEYDKWDASTISSRQRDMATKVISIWKINYL
ncbi:DUF262 domain-containing protein [Runella aurantiaca]|uniref:DUF262 domain-containing protein n=1 Tax=Runella aurantiaca TaxID=2282308 RepID=A0A369I520_9BACT|nr:DUF262 domain-containing protein [Runella aurantiaca]RDB03980.1 DUF262 domain-containing protein [Runella aurantiaca]